MKILIIFPLILFISSLFWACSKNNPDDDMQPDPEVVVCDSTLQPIVMVHGFLASGDTYETQSLRFIANKFCPERIFQYNWNSLQQANIQELSDFIDDVLAQTNSEKVMLAGHSAGSNLCFDYIFNHSNENKVSHYVHLAGNPGDVPASTDVKVLNIYSPSDPIVQGGMMSGAENIVLTYQDHYQVATSEPTFVHMYTFFSNGTAPMHSEIPQATSDYVSIAGKAITMGENEPIVNGRVEIYSLLPESGFRNGFLPEQTFIIDEHGNWGPFDAIKGQTYEFLLISTAPSARPVHYYRSGFNTNNPFVYLRGLPPLSSPAGLLLANLPRDDEQSVVALFTSNQSVIHGRDELECNDVNLSTSQLAPAQASNIAFFLYDNNNNRETDGTAIPNFAMLPFLTGVDIYFNTDVGRVYDATFNEQTIYFRNWKSESEGLIVVVFD